MEVRRDGIEQFEIEEEGVTTKQVKQTAGVREASTPVGNMGDTLQETSLQSQ